MSQRIKSIKEFKEQGKIVLVRVDYNGFSDKDSSSAYRIIASVPTLKYLSDLGSKIIILAHEGRPAGKSDPSLSLEPAALKLAEIMNRKFVRTQKAAFPDYPVPHVIFYSGKLEDLNHGFIVKNLNKGDILFLENIRFYAGEEKANRQFAKQLASLGDVFVNEAFSASHRNSASVTLLPELLPHYAGLQFVKELEVYDKLQSGLRKPFVLAIGGAKISEKAKLFSKFLPEAHKVLIGGALANLFLLAKGYELGDSLVEKNGLLQAKEILRNYKDKIVLPVDVVIGRSTGLIPESKSVGAVSRGERILDIGPQTILNFATEIKKAETIIWNGPMGMFEKPQFAHGTLSLARLIASRGKSRAYVVVGGGETAQALHRTKLQDMVDFESTAGGAMLAYLGGDEMPGLEGLVETSQGVGSQNRSSRSSGGSHSRSG